MVLSGNPRSSQGSSTDENKFPPLGQLLRGFWMLFSNMGLAISIFAFMQKRTTSLTFPDAVFWVLVLSMIIVRLIDIMLLKGFTIEGQPANFGHWKRYASRLLLYCSAAWLTIHGLAIYALEN